MLTLTHCYYLILRLHSSVPVALTMSFIVYIPIMSLFPSEIVPQSFLDF